MIKLEGFETEINKNSLEVGMMVQSREGNPFLVISVEGKRKMLDLEFLETYELDAPISIVRILSDKNNYVILNG